jgi:hypothetical protein
MKTTSFDPDSINLLYASMQAAVAKVTLKLRAFGIDPRRNGEVRGLTE